MTQTISATVYPLGDSLTQDYIESFIADKNRLYEILIDDQPYVIEAKWLLVNLIFWAPMIRRNLPIKKTYLIHNEYVKDSVRVRVHTEMYNDAIAVFPDQSVQLQSEMIASLEQLYNMINCELGDYHRGLSMLDISRTFRVPEIQEVTSVTLTDEIKQGINVAEEKYKKHSDKVLKVFHGSFNHQNVFSPYLNLDCLNNKQFAQVVWAAGPRTDVDESMVTLPIQKSYLEGFDNIVEFAIDSLSAKKSVVYNAREMSNAQYSNRKQQLLAATLRYIYPGDCGSDVLVPFMIHPEHAGRIVGKNIVHQGKLLELSKDTIKPFYNRIVMMRSVMTCRYVDGYCHACGGRIATQLPRTVNPGIASSIETISPVSQQVLSNKHLAQTVSSFYILPEELRGYFTNNHNDIFLNIGVDLDKIIVGIPVQNIEKVSSDLQHVEGDEIPDQYFSSLSHMFIAKADTFEPLTPMVNLSSGKSFPYLSSTVLKLIRDQPETLMIAPDSHTAWLKLSGFDRKKPFMRVVVTNDSTKVFVKRIEEMFSQRIKDYNSIPEILKIFSKTLWERASPHLMHLETMLRACMITSPHNYDIPVVTDIENVMFEQLAKIIPRRSIGQQLAFQRWPMYTSDPATYVFPKRDSMYDTFLGYRD